MIKKANYKPTLPLFGERFLEGNVKSVRFTEENDSQHQQYDSLYDENMKEFFNRPKIKKRLYELGLTDSNGNAIGNKTRERNAVKKKHLLKEREEVVKKIRTREADRIARLASVSNRVTKSCVACDTHNRILSYLRSHMCPIHSNVTYQRAKDTLKNSAAHDVTEESNNDDNLAKLETENKTLKNLWYSEVLRMEEEALQQRLKYEKRRLQQVHLELKKLEQQKEATEMESLEQIKVNLYSKIKRRLGLQALLTTLREAEESGVDSTLFDIDPNVSDWAPPPPQLNRLGQLFQYLPPPPTQFISTNTQGVRPSSAPITSQSISELSLGKSSSFHYNDQLKKRPTSSRGYSRTTDNIRGPYSWTMSTTRQTGNISPLVNSTTALTQQFSSSTGSNSSFVNQPQIIKGDVDDDTMAMEEPEAVLDGLSDVEVSTPLHVSTSDEPVTFRDKIQPRRQAYSVTAESALAPRPIIPTRSTPTNLAKIKQSSEKRVNFMIDHAPPLSSVTEEDEVGNMITEIIHKAKEQCETIQNDEGDGANTNNDDIMVKNNVRSADEPSNNNADTTGDSADTTKVISDQGDTPNDIINETADNQNSIPSVPSAQITSGDGPLNIDAYDSMDTLELEQLIAENKPIAVKKRSNLLIKQTSSMLQGKATQAKKLKSSSSIATKKLGSKISKQFEKTTKAKQSTAKQGVKQTSKKPNKVNQDWKKTILQKVKK